MSYILGDILTEGAGDFIVLESSKHVHFLPDASPIAVDEIAPIIAASFGLPFQKVDFLFWLQCFKNAALFVFALSACGIMNNK